MSFVVRSARLDDLDALYRMAKSAGSGLTNLPPNRAALRERLERADTAFARHEEDRAEELFIFILEDGASGKVRGTCQIFSQIGTTWPFYSYRIAAMTQHSEELGRSFRAEMLQLCTDLDGSSEVGGLFLDANERAAGVGKLLARSRYLFMTMHRSRFADRTIAELRGAIDDTGASPFWDGVAGRFFGMSFREADAFNAAHGNQFIADLMPKHPIYTALIAESAQAVIGVPHTSGRAAMRMLEDEGFIWENYIDIFDGGPTMCVSTDRIATVRAAREEQMIALDPAPGGEPTHLVAHGKLGAFRTCFGTVRECAGGVALDTGAAALLRIEPGATITVVPR